jgi:type I restriction enzyme S subunit
VFSCHISVDPGFLFRVLKSPAAIAAFQLHEQASVDRRGAVRYRDFAKVTIDLPPIDEQRRIAGILEMIDGAIHSTELVIEKLEMIREGLLRDLLTRGVDDDGQLRDPLGRPEDFVDTELGFIPSAWAIRTFGELADYLNGYAFKPGDWKDAGRPIIRIQNINGSTTFNYYDGPVPSHCEIMLGDLIFAWSGTRDSSFGPTIWRGPDGLLNQHIFRVYENTDLVSRGFLHSLLAHNLERIATSAHGFKASFVHVKRGELTSVKVAVPTKAEQERILLVVQDHEKLSSNEFRTLKSLRAIKEGLLDDLLAGRVRVPADDEAAA